MKILDIDNKTGLKIPLEDWIKEIQSDVDRIDKSKYPIKVIISNSEYDEEKNHWEHSSFKPGEEIIVIKVVPNTTLRQIKWSFMHEFRHFMQKNIPEIKLATHNMEDIDSLKELINKIKELDDDDFYEAFHDIFPMEFDAIQFATEKVGKNFRKHPLKDTIPQYINGEKENN